MLRGALPLGRRAATALRQQQLPTHGRGTKRLFAQNTKPSINDPTPPVLPGRQSLHAAGTATTSPPLAVSDKTIPQANVPLVPATSSTAKQASPPTTIPPHIQAGPSDTPPPPKKPRRYWRSFLALVLLTGIGFCGSVWYSLVSDNFHDFFTEYVPFGEDAVLYFEEREFRRRFPRVLNQTRRPTDLGQRVTIPSGSGLSSRERKKDEAASDLESKGPHMNAVPTPKSNASSVPETKQPPAVAITDSTPAAPKTEEKTTMPMAQKESLKASEKAPEPPDTPKADSNITKTTGEAAQPTTQKPARYPEVNEPNVFISGAQIDPVSAKSDEPLVQDLAAMLNSIITVVNTDNAVGTYNASINKAKDELAQIAEKVSQLKAAERAAADAKVSATQADFDRAAQELLRRLEREMHEQESRWKGDFDAERRRILEHYEERLKTEVEKSQQIAEQQAQNKLVEQSLTLKKQFARTIQDRVETEREGRLANLEGLSSSMEELEKLTGQWNDVLDTNIKTQHLQVAVEAVRAMLDQDGRQRPFVRELAALKELATENPVIDSAIASINPSAYQRGLPTTAMLIERYRRVADEVRKASLLPEDAGLTSHAASLILSKVMFRREARALGDDVESILTRTEHLLEEGNFDEAAREMNMLQGWPKVLSKDWLAETRKMLEVRQALEVISTEARLQSLKVDS